MAFIFSMSPWENPQVWGTQQEAGSAPPKEQARGQDDGMMEVDTPASLPAVL